MRRGVVKQAAVVDTNVASFLWGGKAEAALYRDDLVDRRLLLSFQTVAEMRLGAELKSWGKKKRAELEAFLLRHGTIFPDPETLVVWSRMQTEMRKNGKTISYPDSWIAAVAIASDLPLIAHDAVFRFVPKLKLICHAPA
jgi:predicted nucleic acid-binding protein